MGRTPLVRFALEHLEQAKSSSEHVNPIKVYGTQTLKI